ncbi:MAG: T9SS type A sorting domain-containing protein [Bacteroidota bacterium]
MKKTITLLSSIFVCFISYAQTEIRGTDENLTKRIIAERQQTINESPFIFEGTVIKTVGFQAKDKGIYTSNTIQINKVFRGNPLIKLGTIEVITEGGTVDAILKDGSLGSRESYPYHGQVRFYPGQSGTFFCVPADSNLIVQPVTTKNAVKTKYRSCISYPFEGYGGIIGMNLSFKSYDELYDFLRNQKNITIPEPNIEKKSIDVKPEKIKSDTIGNSIRYKQNVKNYETNFAHLLNKIKTSGVNPNRGVSAINDITFTLANPQQTDSANFRYFEFDIMASANSNATYFDGALFRISYNTSAFGSSVVFNNKVRITRGATFNNITYTSPNADKIDQNPSTIGVPINTNFNQTSWNRTLITTSPVQLLHFKIQIQNCGQNVNIDFADQSFTPMFSYYTTTATASITGGVPYDNTSYQNPLNTILCQLLINNFNSPVNAGTSDILTIDGSGFGATRKTGQVKFKNADNGGGTYIQKLNTIDYISWSNTQIKIKVPSVIDSLPAANYPIAPGSGNIIVKNSFGDSAVSTNNLQIYYGAVNKSITSPQYQKLRTNLVNINGSGGYTLHLNPNISSIAGAKGCIIKAMHDWKCYTGINWVLGPDVAITSSVPDGSCVLYFSNLTATGNFAITTPQGVTCSGSTNYAIMDEADIAFDQGSNWFCDTTGLDLPAGKVDFYEVALHELGHFQLLTHVNNINELMYYTPKIDLVNNILAVNRRRLSPSTAATDGGSNSVTNSIAVIVGACSYTDMIQQFSTNCTNSVDEIKGLLMSFKIYPNPTADNTVNISYNLETSATIKIHVIDYLGRQALSLNEENEYSGEHEKQIDVTNLSSGIYLIVTNINGQIITNKLIKR